jgi:hypothetical protein
MRPTTSRMNKVRLLAVAVVAFMLVAVVVIAVIGPSGSSSTLSANGIVTTLTAEANILALKPVADSYIDSEKQDTNYGSAAALRIDGSPSKRAYLKFDLSGMGGEIERVLLRIYAQTRISGRFELRQADGDWEERTLTFLNAPQAGEILLTGDPVTTGYWAEVDVTNLVPLDGSFTFVISTNAKTQTALGSKESANPPELLITYKSATETGARPTELPAFGVSLVPYWRCSPQPDWRCSPQPASRPTPRR